MNVPYENDHQRDTHVANEAGLGAKRPAPPEPPSPAGETGSLVRGVGMRLVETAFRSSRRDKEAEEDVFAAANFEQVKNQWWLDRALPGNVKKYFAAAFMVCTMVWLIGLTLRLMTLGLDDFWAKVWMFVKDRQWQLQPLLLFVHFVCLRLFKGIYSRNFDRAFRHMDVKQTELDGYKRWFLGRRANLFALAIAAPFILWDWLFFFLSASFYEKIYGTGSQFLSMIDPTSRTGEGWLMLTVWTFEWLMYGFYIYLMLSGAFVVRHIMKRHQFVDSVDLVLTERQYRPMFQVIAQAGSLVFCYGLIYLGYMLYTKSTDSDIAGLGLLVLILSTCFGLTWGAVRSEIKADVNNAIEELEKSYRACREKLGTMKDVPGIEDDILRIQVQLKMQLALQQLDYLQTKYESLGRREFLGLMFKMLAPVGTVLARIIRWGSLLAAIGLGGAAAISNVKEQQQPAAVESNAPVKP